MSQRPESLNGLRILVVDDEPKLARGLKRWLAMSGAQVTIASCVADALLALDRHEPWDVALIDQILPDGDGLDVVATIDRREHKPAVIAVSANLQSSKRSLRLQGYGAVLLPKPFDPDDLATALFRALDGRRRANSMDAATQPSEQPTSSKKQLRYKNICLDLITQTASVDGIAVELQPAQIRILAHLLTYPGRCFGTEELTRAVLRGTHARSGGNIRFQIHSLRRRLGTAACHIETFNRGYGVALSS